MKRCEGYIGRCAICGKIISAKTLKEFDDKLEKHMKKHEKDKLFKKNAFLLKPLKPFF